MKKSKIFFILTAVFVVITIICIIIEKNMSNELNGFLSKDYNDEYKAETEYKLTGDRTKLDELQKEKEKMYELEDKRDTIVVVSIVAGGLTVALLVTGVVLKVKEKKEEK